jgi:hypothetical protein
MTVPPQRLVQPGRLEYDGLLPLRTADNKLDSKITMLEAWALAFEGKIEGVCSGSGRLRFFRYLSEKLKQESEALDHIVKSSSTAFARTNMGVFREPVGTVEVAEAFDGTRTVTAEGDIVGYVYTHCALRERRPVTA